MSARDRFERFEHDAVLAVGAALPCALVTLVLAFFVGDQGWARAFGILGIYLLVYAALWFFHFRKEWLDMLRVGKALDLNGIWLSSARRALDRGDEAAAQWCLDQVKPLPMGLNEDESTYS